MSISGVLDRLSNVRGRQSYPARGGVQAATTVRVGSVSCPSPTAPSPSGFILIETRDLSDAIQMAAKIPLARRSSIEVRPMKELKP